MPNGEDGPFCDPITCSSRQGIAPELGQLGSVPAVMLSSLLPQMTLLSKELCHVGLPNGSFHRRYSAAGRRWRSSVRRMGKTDRFAIQLPAAADRESHPNWGNWGAIP